jgi:ring-1,2-phenylacetyl-CoA epoxidase subunit PaaD
MVSTEHAWTVAAATQDPELPVLTIGDLGILRSMHVEGSTLVATITPTYSGCPAMTEISRDVQRRLNAAGYAEVDVRLQLAPAWTSEWITPHGRSALHTAGIAPPRPVAARSGPIPLVLGATKAAIACPRCGTSDTERRADFGATACRALYRCTSCGEPFEYVKEI